MPGTTRRHVEHLPDAPEDDRGLPDLSFAFYDRMVVFDHISKTVAAVAHAHIDPNNLRKGYDDACARVDRLVERLQQGVAELQVTDIDTSGPVTIPHQSNFSKDGFQSAVLKCKEYINAGDIFQVVLSQRFKASAAGRDIYRAASGQSVAVYVPRQGWPTTLSEPPRNHDPRRRRPGYNSPTGRHSPSRGDPEEDRPWPRS